MKVSCLLKVRGIMRRISIMMIAIIMIVVAGFVRMMPAETALADLTYSLEERQRICEEIWHKIDLWYSYFDDKDIDWESVRQVYLDEVAEARSDYEFFASMGAMVRELQDSHSYMYDYPKPVSINRGKPGIRIAEAEGKPVVAEVVPGSDAEGKGIVPGLEIVSVDGYPAEECISSLVPLVHLNTVACAGVAVAAILEGDVDTMVQVELMSLDGNVLNLQLIREPFVRQTEAITARILWGTLG